MYSSIIDSFFSENTMSVHVKSGTAWSSKIWKPWIWTMVSSKKIISQSEIKCIIDTIFQELKVRDDATIEIDRPLSKVIQMGLYRIVIVFPPLSDDYELTIVRPIKKLQFDDYQIDDSLRELLQNKAQWILVCGSPWSWKTTFTQALVDYYVNLKKIVKTVEAPRDLLVSEDVVQYSFHHWTHDEIRDILLLSRPDFTIYDEIRNTNDFILYKDLRLTGIGLVWVIHATQAIDSIQRFIGILSLGMIPQVIDTVLFISWWMIHTVYTLSFTVKTPSGMLSEDLARPVVEVKDFYTWQLVYELYSFGEQVVVMPLNDINIVKLQSGAKKLAERYIQNYFHTILQYEYYIDTKENNIDIYVPFEEKWSLIGKWWDNIRLLEKELAMRISVKTFDELPESHNFIIIQPKYRTKKRKNNY
jgi:ATPase